MTQKLAGKVALVTGSGRGIGRCIALKLASEGARLVVNDLEAGPAEEVVALIRERGGEAVACVGSVTAPEEAADAVYLLCTPESNYISGQTVVCGGGLAL